VIAVIVSALFEMLLISDWLRDPVTRGVPVHELRKAAREDVMKTLLDRGLELTRRGEISLGSLPGVVFE
jgi:type II secretory ATPase GspE/PulE/Tfp pilus assembly ATPase PilB-like protein